MSANYSSDNDSYATLDVSKKNPSNNDLYTTVTLTKKKRGDGTTRCANHHKIKIAFILTLVGFILFVINIVILIVIFVKIDNLERSKEMSPVSSITEDRLKILEGDIRNVNHTTLNIFENISQLARIFSGASPPNAVSNGGMNLNISSCLTLQQQNLPSGYYSLPSPTGELTRVYCDMDLTCGNITGGWMRVADLDLYNCPPGLRYQTVQGNIACIRTEFSGGCTPVLYNTYGIPYSKVCGTITGYGVNTPDGFRSSIPTNYNVNDNYVDGIVVQSGVNHIWTYVAGQCTRCSAPKHHFIGDDWICDGRDCSLDTYCDGPLWDAPICGSSNPFFKNMSSFSTADIGLRVCRDENRNNEDIAITDMKIYVQ